jgi:polygalacturonase
VTTPTTPEQARAAVASAVVALRELRDTAERVVPERSRGRRQILEACDAALAATATAIQGDASVGDDTPAMWRRALELARAAVRRTSAFVAEVARTPARAAARLWDVSLAVAEAARRTIADQLERARAAAQRAVEVAASVLGGLVAASAGVMFSGWVVLAAGVMLYLAAKD